MSSTAGTARVAAPRSRAVTGPASRAAVLGVLAAVAALAISPLPLWARSVRDVVGNGFARIVHDAAAWSILVAPWVPLGVAAVALAGLAAGGVWLARGRPGAALPLAGAWLGLALIGTLALAAPLLPGVLDAYRGPRGFHEMHLGPLSYAALGLALVSLTAAAFAMRRSGGRPPRR